MTNVTPSDASPETPDGGRAAMLDFAWDLYRGWAKRARTLQASADRWNLAALVFVGLAAVCGAATEFVPAAPNPWNVAGPWLAGAATLAFAIGAYFGREVVSAGAEPGYIQARATAEAIKSDCFRFAAKAGPYAGSDAEAAPALQQRLAELGKTSADLNLTPKPNPAPPEGDKRKPPIPLDKAWYKANRIGDQIDFYQKGAENNERTMRRLMATALASELVAVAFGALGAFGAQRFAPLIGAMTTIAASVAAYGLIDRRRYLVASYAEMAQLLGSLRALDETIPASVTDLVARTEDLLESEHKTWAPRMLANSAQGPAGRQAESAAGRRAGGLMAPSVRALWRRRGSGRRRLSGSRRAAAKAHTAARDQALRPSSRRRSGPAVGGDGAASPNVQRRRNTSANPDSSGRNRRPREGRRVSLSTCLGL